MNVDWLTSLKNKFTWFEFVSLEFLLIRKKSAQNRNWNQENAVSVSEIGLKCLFKLSSCLLNGYHFLSILFQSSTIIVKTYIFAGSENARSSTGILCAQSIVRILPRNELSSWNVSTVFGARRRVLVRLPCSSSFFCRMRYISFVFL